MGETMEYSILALDPAKRIGILIYNEQAFNSAKRQHHEYWDWRRNRNESRCTAQERGQMDYDAKNMMHLVQPVGGQIRFDSIPFLAQERSGCRSLRQT